jgi:two-component system sensor histidine kinase CreC
VKKQLSISIRIFLAFAVVATGGCYWLLHQLTKRVERQYLEAAEEPMVDIAHLVAGIVQETITDDTINPDALTHLRDGIHHAKQRQFEALIYDFLKTEIGLNVYVTDQNGIVIFDSAVPEAAGTSYRTFRDVHYTLKGDYGARSTRTNEEDSTSSVMFVGAPVLHNDQIIGMVSVSKPQANMFVFMKGTKERIWYLGFLALMLILLSAFLMIRWMTRPVERLTQYARAIGRGERVPLPALGKGEIADLGHAFEDMRDVLEGRNYAETYVQTLTHEMKSPVAAIQGAAELLGDKNMPDDKRLQFLTNIQSETVRLQNIIDRLLALSEIEGRKTLQDRAPVNLTKLTERICAEHRQAANAKKLTLETDLQNDAIIEGESFLLEMAIANLLQNAINFTPNEGTIRISLIQTTIETKLSVQDDGPGLPDYALDRVFERFYSLRDPASGKKSSGLGLCFVREAAQLHGGQATITNRTDNSGAIATLIIPFQP